MHEIFYLCFLMIRTHLGPINRLKLNIPVDNKNSGKLPAEPTINGNQLTNAPINAKTAPILKFL